MRKLTLSVGSITWSAYAYVTLSVSEDDVTSGVQGVVPPPIVFGTNSCSFCYDHYIGIDRVIKRHEGRLGIGSGPSRL